MDVLLAMQITPNTKKLVDTENISTNPDFSNTPEQILLTPQTESTANPTTKEINNSSTLGQNEEFSESHNNEYQREKHNEQQPADSKDYQTLSTRPKIRLPNRTIKPMTVKQSDDLTVQIEKIMEEGLSNVFKELNPVQQQEFKLKGEETAGKIRQLLTKTHVKIKKIFQLLLNWLTFLPGVGRFFLEQEAKIKADKILHLKHRHDTSHHT